MNRRGRLIGRRFAIPWVGALVIAALVTNVSRAQRTAQPRPPRTAQAPLRATTFPDAQSPPSSPTASAQTSEGSRLLPAQQTFTAPTGEAIATPRQEGPGAYTVPLRGPADGMVLEHEDGLISLVARNASLQDVLTALAETEGLNLITQDSVNAQVNATLHRLPFTDVLDILLSTSGYTWVLNRNVIQVTTVANGQNLAPETQGRQVEVFQLDFVSATDVSSVVQTMLSPIGTANVIESSPEDNRRTQELLVVQDMPTYLASIRDYIRKHDVPPRQVLIEAYILKVELGDDLKHGVDFDHFFNMSNNLFQLDTRGLATATPTKGFVVNLSGGNLAAVVEMLENTTDAKTLAAPKIRVLNGQTARIQVGEQLGFRVATVTQTSTVQSVDFLDVGVVLEVTPRIASDGTVIMRVSPEVSSGQVNVTTGLPEEKTTELQTDVMFRNNQAYVIGGLIQETDSDLQSKIPWLGNLKHIGFFFKRSEVLKKRSEIIVALLPRVMPFDPIADQEMLMATESATTPLLYGPLLTYPRPWEAQLPGAYLNPHMHRLPATWDYLSLQDSYDSNFEMVPQQFKSLGESVPTGPLPASPDPPPVYQSQRTDAGQTIGASRISRLPTTTLLPSKESVRTAPPTGTILR
ncbi:MAG: hypothetical protein ABI614_00975 [Planctomycetota bacterium]